MNIGSPFVNFNGKIQRYSKNFEAIQGNIVQESMWRIPATEYKAAGYGDADEVPEGLLVKIATPGTRTKNSVSVTYAVGDLEICSADDTEVYGITMEKVIPAVGQDPYYKKPGQLTAFRGQNVTVVTGDFLGIFMSKILATGFNMASAATYAPKVGIYAGLKGIPSVPGVNGVAASPAGKAVGFVVANTSGQKKFDGTTLAPDEVVVKLFLNGI
jgi:hypothetical protein